MLGRIGHDGRTSKSLGRRQFLGTLGATVAAAGGLAAQLIDRLPGEPAIYFSSVKNFSPRAKRLGLRKKPRMMAPLGATAS